MTFITGYQNLKGPYITNFKQRRGLDSSIETTSGADVLIWNIFCHNHDDTNAVHFSIYDNAKDTNHDTIGDTDFLIFRQYLSHSRIAHNYYDPGEPSIPIAGQAPFASWTLETPILARNGTKIRVTGSLDVGGGDIDYYLGYSILGTSTPYRLKVKEGAQVLVSGGSGYTGAPTVSFTGGGGAGATATAAIALGVVTSVTVASAKGGGNYTSIPNITFSGGGGTGANFTAILDSPSAGEQQTHANIKPDLICTKGLANDPESSSYQALSSCDCEIWGMKIWNLRQEQRIIHVKNGADVSVMQIPIDQVIHAGWGDHEDVQTYTSTVHQMFKIPIFCQGGLKTQTRDGTNSSNVSGVAITLLVRELGTNNALTSGNIR